MRPYKITEDTMQTMMNKFSEYLKNMSMTENIVSFSEKMVDTNDNDTKASIKFAPKAYIKMRDIIDRYDSEVGWFGFIDKINSLEYLVTDICVYPQLVTGSTVKETNEPWDDDMPIAMIKRRHFHGHSHVNMGTNPSGVDIQHRKDQLALVKPDSFFVFMITNKRCEWTAAIFDIAENKVYETKDISIDVDLGDGELLSDFVADTKKFVKKSTPAAVQTMMDQRNGVKTFSEPKGTGASPWLPKAKIKTNTKAKKKSKKTSQASFLDEMSDQEWMEYVSDHYYEADSCDDYEDGVFGVTSESPATCSKYILDHYMR